MLSEFQWANLWERGHLENGKVMEIIFRSIEKQTPKLWAY
jgi:hypothetical protein